MASRMSRVLIQTNQGDPFIHSFLIPKAIKFGKKFLGKILKPSSKTKAVLVAAGGGAVGAAAFEQAAGFVGPPRTLAGVAGQEIIKAGVRFVFDPLTGQHVPMKKRRRRRGITATELSGFRKVNRLLHSVGMTPRKTRRKS